MRLEDMESKLRDAYGTAFDTMLNEAVSKYGARRAALNALRYQETETELVGPFVSSAVRRATRGERKGEVFQVSFRVIDGAGRPALVIASSDAIDWVKQKFPDVGRLVPVKFGAVTQRTDLLSGGRTFFVQPGKTTLSVLKDDGTLDFTFNVSTVAQAVAAQEASTGERDPFSVVYGEITDVRSYGNPEIESVKVTITDMDGTTISAKVEEHLTELVGEHDWLNDREAVRNSLLGMPVLAGGRVFIGKAGDLIGDRPLESDVTSFVVKNGGWIVDLETVTPSVYQAVLNALKPGSA